MKIIKRNGAEVPFDITKIITAVTKASDSVGGKARLSREQITDIAAAVTDQCQALNRAVSVEEVQDMVENQLMDIKAHDIARHYITYRYIQSLKRQTNTTDERILSLIECQNEEVKQENANKNPTVNSVQRDYMAGEISKDLTARLLLDPEIVKAHQEGLIHFHDSDYFAQHMLGKIVGVVEVDETFLMRLNDLRVQQQAGSQVFGDLTGHIVALDAVDGGVLVGVLLLDFFVLALDEAQDALVGGVGLALEALDIAVGDIVAGDVMGLDVHELVFHHILYLFHADSAVECLTLVGHSCGDVSDLLPGETGLAAYRIAGLGNSGDDLGNIKRHFRTVAFDDLHSVPPVSRIQCERVSPDTRGTRNSHWSLILSYHYLVICQWKNHYILCFVAFAKNRGKFPEQNLRRNLLTICAKEVVLSAG